MSRFALLSVSLLACTPSDDVLPAETPTHQEALGRTYVASYDAATDWEGASPFFGMDVAFSVDRNGDGALALFGSLVQDGSQVCADPYEVGPIEAHGDLVNANGDLYVEMRDGRGTASAVFDDLEVEGILWPDGALTDVHVAYTIDLRRNPGIDIMLGLNAGLPGWCDNVMADCVPCADGAPVCQDVTLYYEVLTPADDDLSPADERCNGPWE